jgi:hypothetical protein
MKPWSERLIARAIALQTFKRRYLAAVPNCNWTGHECDLLLLTENLRIIDVEIKISRADLKADAKKEKWWHRPYNWPFTYAHGRLHGAPAPDVPLLHPKKAWKHYYAMPMEIWKDELFDALPSTASGVLLLNRDESGIYVHAKRYAKPSRDAEPVSAKEAVDIARLASLRMWESFQEVENMRNREVAHG